jgi:hypothetical protein
MVERRFEEIDEGSLRAEPLTEIVSTEEAQEDPFGAILDKDGAIRLKRAAKKVDLPPDSEQLRIRLKILSTSFMLARYQHSTRPWLQTCTPGIWLEHVDYVLGPEVYGYSIAIEGVKVSPSWSVVLAYEFQLRKKAVREVMYNGMDIARALEIARKCSETKEQYFTTPMALSTAVATQVQGTRQNWKQDYRNQQGNQNQHKGGRGGKGKQGKGGRNGKGGKAQTKLKFKRNKKPDGRLICYRFQSKGCERAGCGFIHVCAWCLADHPMVECSANKESKEAK